MSRLDNQNASEPLPGASFSVAIKRYFTKYAVFSGRASRSEYWWSQLFVALCFAVPALFVFIGGMIGTAYAMSHPRPAYEGLVTYPGWVESPIALFFLLIGAISYFVLVVGSIIPTLAITWRRLHDANLPGPLWFLSLIPFGGSIIILVFSLLPSDPQGQRFDAQR